MLYNLFFFYDDTATTDLYTLSLHDALPILFADEKQFPELVNPHQMAFDTKGRLWVAAWPSYPHWKPKDAMSDKLIILEDTDRKSTRLNSSHSQISYAVFCLKKKNNNYHTHI